MAITHLAKPFIPTSNDTSQVPPSHRFPGPWFDLPTAHHNYHRPFGGGSSRAFRLPVPMIVLMEEILHQLIGRLSHYLQDFMHRRWCRISSISNRNHFGPSKKKGFKFLGFACLMLGKSRNIFSHMVIFHGKKCQIFPFFSNLAVIKNPCAILLNIGLLIGILVRTYVTMPYITG